VIYKEYQPEHESLLLAALMIDNSVYDELEMRENDFQLPHNRYLYSVIAKIIERGETANLVTVSALIDQTKIKTSYLSEITSKNFTAANVKFYADRIKAIAQRRKLEKLIMRMQEWVSTLDTDEVFEEIEKFLREESETHGDSVTQIRSRLIDYLKELESRMKNHRKIVGLPTGFPGLDIETGGFRNGEFIVIGARPSMGKTTLALNIARNMCTESKINIGFFSIETSSNILIEKLLAAEAGVNSRSMQTGELKTSDMPRLMNAASTLAGKVGDFWFDDTSELKITELRSRSRMLMRRGVKIIFIDYLTLIDTAQKNTPRHEQVADISRSLKTLARQLMIPVVVLSQVRRETQGKMPTLADIRESGSIEQDSDVIIFLHREPNEELTKIDVAKNRNWGIGETELMFNRAYSRFESVVRREG
jgi:replicative DNA helicase